MRFGVGVIALISSLLGASAQAQVTPYTVTHEMGTYSALPSGTDHVPTAYGTQPAWDEGAARIALPFDFEYFGVAYTEVWAFTNGFLSFEPPPRQTIIGPAIAVPDPRAPNAIIAPLWQDLDRDRSTMPLPPPPRIRSTVIGAAPRRSIAIEYSGFKRARSTLSSVNFRVTLHEGTHRVEIVYGPNSGIINATAVMEGAGGADGFDLHRASASCTGNCPCAPVSCGSIGNFPDGLVVRADLPPAPELVGGLSAPSGALAGASFGAVLTARNAGLVATGGFEYKVYISPSDASLAGATELGRYRSSGLAATTSETSTQTYTVPAGLPVGTYYLAVEVDSLDEVAEAIESNNVYFFGPFRTGPELGPGRLVAPRRTGPGEALPVQLEIANGGAPDIRAFDVQFWLSTDDVLDASDVPAGTRTLRLTDGESFAGEVVASVPLDTPLSPPDYNLLAVLDVGSDIAEVDETNNVIVSALPLTVEGPDLIVSSVESATVAVRGEVFPVQVVLQNDGGAMARNVTLCLLASSDAVLDASSDRVLERVGLFDVPAGETQILRLEPVAPRAWTAAETVLGAVLDCENVVVETDESNNAGARSQPVEPRDPAPDYVVESLVVPTQGAAGEVVRVGVRMSNVGTDDGAPSLALRLSPDAGLDPSDPELGRFPLAVLARGEVREQAFEVQLPPTTPSGDVRIFALLDPEDATLEVNEQDNLRRSVPVRVLGASLAIVGAEPPPARFETAYAWQFSALGPDPERSWSIEWTEGAPDGLSLDASGLLSGTAPSSAGGAYPYVLSVSSDGELAERSGTLLVVPLGLELRVVTERLQPALRGELYDQPLLAAGGVPPYEWEATTSIAIGLGLSESGRVSGRPGLEAELRFGVRVRDAYGRTATGQIALDVLEPASGLLITTAALAGGVAGEPYQTRFLAEGATGALTWSLEGEVPGLSLDAATGGLSGTPTQVGDYTLSVEVLEASTGRSDRASFVLEVLEPGELRIVGEVDLAPAPLGAAYSEQLQAMPSGDLMWSLVSGDLPPGLSLDGAGLISGTPSMAGLYAFRVEVRDGVGDTARATRVIRAGSGPSVPTPSGGGCRCAQAGSQPWFLLFLLPFALLRRR